MRGVSRVAKRRYFCESCGAEVAASARVCPSCGKAFGSVRCPSCGFEGEAGAFAAGCPVCGYAAPPPATREPEAPGPARTGLPTRFYAIAGVVLGILALALLVLLAVRSGR